MSTPSFVRLEPGRWTGLPGTGCELWWDGDRGVVLARHGRGDDLPQEPEAADGRMCSAGQKCRVAQGGLGERRARLPLPHCRRAWHYLTLPGLATHAAGWPVALATVSKSRS